VALSMTGILFQQPTVQGGPRPQSQSKYVRSTPRHQGEATPTGSWPRRTHGIAFYSRSITMAFWLVSCGRLFSQCLGALVLNLCCFLGNLPISAESADQCYGCMHSFASLAPFTLVSLASHLILRLGAGLGDGNDACRLLLFPYFPATYSLCSSIASLSVRLPFAL
jgi:hypothetical protein